MNGGDFKLGNDQSGQFGGPLKGVGRKEGDVFVVGRVELSQLVHVALGRLDVQLGFRSHDVDALFQKGHIVGNVRKDVLGHNGVEFVAGGEGRKVQVDPPVAHHHVVALLLGQRHNVGGRVHPISRPTSLAKEIELRPVVAGNLQHVALHHTRLTNNLGRQPLKVPRQCVARGRLVQIVIKQIVPRGQMRKMQVVALFAPNQPERETG